MTSILEKRSIALNSCSKNYWCAEVFLDYLADNSNKAAVDKKTMKLIHDIEDLEPSIKDKLIYLANAVIRDAKTGKAYAH